MPTHTISSTFKDDAGSVPLAGTSYVVADEVNAALHVPAGSTDLLFSLEFLFAKVVDYCLSLATQSASQAASNPQGFSEATAGAVTIKVNSTGSPAPSLTLNAKAPHVFAACIPGTVNEFSANVTAMYITNSGAADLVVLLKVGLNS